MSDHDRRDGPSAIGASIVGIIGAGTTLDELASYFAVAELRVIVFVPSAPSSQPAPMEVEQPLAVDVTVDDRRLSEPDTVVIVSSVALTSARGADTASVAVAARMIGNRLRTGQLVVFVGAVPPGTTRTVALPAPSTTGLVPGDDFLLAYSTPPDENGRRTIGGLNTASTGAAAVLFTRAGFGVIRMSSLEAAEVCGALGGLYRTVQTAVTNELKAECNRMGLDAWS